MTRRILVCLVVAAALALAGAPAFAAGTSINVRPNPVTAGRPVTVFGSADGCPVGDQVTLISRAFVHIHDFAGLPAVFATVRSGGTYSVTTTIPATRAPGTYGITGRCGGGNLGVSTALVVRSPSALPFTGVRVLPELAFGLGLVGLGALLAFAARSRPRTSRTR